VISFSNEGENLIGVPYLPLFSHLSSSELDAQVYASENADQQADACMDNVLRIIPASYVTADSGTGLVHCAPAHGVDDYNTFRDLELLISSSSSSTQNIICHVNGAGKFVPEIADVVGEEAAKELVGKDVLKGGGKAMVELLRGMGEDVLLGVEKIKHRYPYDWKTGEPVIVT
jgi:isoleucyl-tRNA synthetase